MTGLAQRAAALARPETDTVEVPQRPTLPVPDPITGAAGVERLPEIDMVIPDEYDPVPVHIAWLRVRREIKAIEKSDRFTGVSSYNFRGVDRVLNAYGPATLRHGVNVFPTRIEPTYRDTKTSKGKATRECTVRVTYLIVGPMGDQLQVESIGESLDYADKGSAKALSVALRSLLLHGGLTPTQDPDPDSALIERGDAAVRTAAEYRDEVLDLATSRERMLQILNELQRTGRSRDQVINEHGDEEEIATLVGRVGKERFRGGGS